ncbi:hypothetical protein CBOM_03583 [Ceraceosorus bombacis]|uniref:Uncharacterized protein n=1 Tax=Ceraceosorus bombacis TaxID=401625 RepID=A0A0P1BGV9_9BASI|nr:hypothetical protein CBOM_03583 [Ceraceosorus bombacis]
MLKRVNLSAAYVLLSTIALNALASPTDALGPRTENFGSGWRGHISAIKGNDSPNERRTTYGGSDGDITNLETEGRIHRHSDAAVEKVQNVLLPRFTKRAEEVPQKTDQGEESDSTEGDDFDLSQNLAYNQTHVVRKGPEGEPQNQRGTLGSSINGFLHGFGTGLGAGSGINWQRGAVGGGWNAGIEKSGVGFGGGYTLTPHNFTFGQGSRFGPISINISFNITDAGDIQLHFDTTSHAPLVCKSRVARPNDGDTKQPEVVTETETGNETPGRRDVGTGDEAPLALPLAFTSYDCLIAQHKYDGGPEKQLQKEEQPEKTKTTTPSDEPQPTDDA